jgi:succinoglycan biosynthesis transport protein ExoP
VQLTDYIKILRRRWWLIALSVSLCVLAAVAVSARQASRYTSTTRLLVTSQGGDPQAVQFSSQIASARAASYAQLIQTPPGVAVVRDLAKVTTETVSVEAAAGGTPFITISVEAGSPEAAQALAAAYPKAVPVIVSRLEQTSTSDVPKLTTIEVASYPKSPTSPRPVQDGEVAAIIGLILGLALALLRETLDGRVRDSGEVEKLSAATMLGLVPRQQPGEPLPARRQPRSARAEAYRQVRANLEFSGADGMPRSLVITSPGPGEGKSTLAANLAVVAAQSGRNVAIVDADLRKPSLARYFNLTPGPGLSEVLAGQVHVDSALVALQEERISVLQSGRQPTLPGELVGSTSMVALLEELEQRFDLVIIDTPPVLPVSDALLIGVNVDGVVLVARMVETSRAALKKAVAALRTVDVSLLGVVGNAAVRREERSYGAGYGYGYGYGDAKGGEVAGLVDLVPAGRRGRDDARPKGRRAKEAAHHSALPVESLSRARLRQRIEMAATLSPETARQTWGVVGLPAGGDQAGAQTWPQSNGASAANRYASAAAVSVRPVNGHHNASDPQQSNGHQHEGHTAVNGHPATGEDSANHPHAAGTGEPASFDDVFRAPEKPW